MYTVRVKDIAPLLRRRERIVLLKEMAGIFASSIAASILAFVTALCFKVLPCSTGSTIAIISGVVVIAILANQNRYFYREQVILEELIVPELATKEKPEDESQEDVIVNRTGT